MEKKTISEMNEVEKRSLGIKAYKLLVRLWAKQNGCVVTEDIGNKDKARAV